MLIKLNFGQFIKGLCSIKTTDEDINNYIPGQLYNAFWKGGIEKKLVSGGT